MILLEQTDELIGMAPFSLVVILNNKDLSGGLARET